MAEPSQTTVTIDGNKFDAFSTQVEFHTQDDGYGTPLMGTIGITVNIHDVDSMSFNVLSTIYDLSTI